LRLLVHDSYEAASRAAARLVARTVSRNPEATLLLPTGSTPMGLYRELVRLYEEGALSLSRATIFNLDEYLGLPHDHPESYRRYMRENLYRHVDADPERTHVPDYRTPEPQAECERYEKAISEAGGVNLCVLGIGRNGHIGFNEPGASFSSRTRVVELAESTRRANAASFDSGEPPERTITIGMRTIFESRKILLLASGTAKAEAVAAAVEGKVTPQTPASMLRRHPDVTLLLEREAASGLGREVA
jgi:glucosamine-6-phosphate deaminase